MCASNGTFVDGRLIINKQKTLCLDNQARHSVMLNPGTSFPAVKTAKTEFKYWYIPKYCIYFLGRYSVQHLLQHSSASAKYSC
jgi:hypothetical protein